MVSIAFSNCTGTQRDEIMELISLAIDRRLDSGVDEEEAQTEVYEKFLSYAVQYHNDGLKPLGIVLGEQLTAVVKSDQVDRFKYKCSDIELHIYLWTYVRTESWSFSPYTLYTRCFFSVCKAAELTNVVMFSYTYFQLVRIYIDKQKHN